MSNDIHPTAIIEKGAQLGDGVSVGAYSIVGPDVVLGDNTIVESHVVINGHTTLGENNHVFPYAAIGGAPQSITYKGEPTQVVIGDNNIFRENVTVIEVQLLTKGLLRSATIIFSWPIHILRTIVV